MDLFVPTTIFPQGQHYFLLYIMSEKTNTSSRISQRIHQHRVLFYWAIPICLVVVYALMFCVPTTYQSSFSFATENPRAVDENRVLTLNNPGQYDLGLAQTRSGIEEYGYADLVSSPQFLKMLFATPVSTIDGKFEGTYAEYIDSYMRKSLLKKIKGLLRNKANTDSITESMDGVMMNRKQASIMATMHKQIKHTIDQHTDVIKIEVVTQDPLVSAQVAKYAEAQLRTFVQDYQMQKMQIVLERLDSLTEQAERDWQEAVREKSPDTEVSKQIYDAFRRQQVIYQAQMVAQSPFVTLSDPVVNYTPKGPHRTMTALLITLIFSLLMGAWVCRREIAEAL